VSRTNVRLLLLCLALGGGSAEAAVRIIDVDVYKNVNAWTSHAPNNYVTQTFVLTSDSLRWAEAFIGQPNGLGHPYSFQVMNSSSQVICRGTADDSGRGWRYVHAGLHVSTGVQRHLKVPS